MALPNAALVQTAYQELYGVFANDKTLRGTRHAVSKLNWIGNALNRLYGSPVDIKLTADSDDADVAAFIAAEATMSAGTILRITSTTEDFTDNALGTAKNAEGDGAIVATDDIYVLDAAGTGVVYLGNNKNDDGNSIPFDFAGEQVADFINI